MSLHVQCYLSRYAQPEAVSVLDAGIGEHESVLVVPCYDESPNFLDGLLPTCASDLLVVVVVNAPDNAPPDALNRTEELLRKLCSTNSGPLSMVSYSTAKNVNLLVIDRTSGERLIPYRQGVGLARKIGADVALALIYAHKVHHPWIYATDADVSLPDAYLHTPMPESGTALFPFRHTSEDSVLAARAELYELHLRYYVNRLADAGSPYAFHTLGSTTAIHADAYAKVRGYPRRNAGEDFYLLNKLAKVDAIHRLHASATPSTEITIHARYSERVPFGTGPALAKIPLRTGAYLSYAPASFRLLREVLDGIRAVVSGERWHASSKADNALQTLDFFAALGNAKRQHHRPGTLVKALHQWFDGFRTLRFIHECRRHHPDEPLLESLAATIGPVGSAPDASPHLYLDRLRNIEKYQQRP